MLNLKELQARAKEHYDALQDAMQRLEAHGTSGTVALTINGRRQILDITISSKIIENDSDRKKLENDIRAAVNEAAHKADEAMLSSLASLLG